jgi:hypothetical protein
LDCLSLDSPSRRYVNEFSEVLHHHMCAVLFERLIIALASDTDDKAEVSGTTGLDP